MKVGKRARGRTNCGMEGSDQRPSSQAVERQGCSHTTTQGIRFDTRNCKIAESPGVRDEIGDFRGGRDWRCSRRSFGGCVSSSWDLKEGVEERERARGRERAGDVDAATKPNTVRLQERGNQSARVGIVGEKKVRIQRGRGGE